jgi:hypothetical protein
MCINLCAQDIQTTFENKTDASGKGAWHLLGTTDLPNFTTLTVRLSYQDTVLLPNAQVRVVDGAFQHRYGVRERMPSGKYVYEIAYCKKLQVPQVQDQLAGLADFTRQHIFDNGDAHQQRLELQEVATFYKAMLAEVENFCQVSRTQSEALLKEPTPQNLDKAREWLSQTRQKFQQLSGRISESDTVFLQVHAHESMEDMLSLATPLRQLWQIRAHAVRKAYDIPPPFEAEKIAPAGVPASFENEIARISQAIVARLPQAQNIVETVLEEDLRWFNQVFSDIVQCARQTETNFDKAKWQEKFVFWQQELQDFTVKTAEYQKSPLVSNYPTLPKDLEQLAQEGKNLLLAYTALVYKRAGVAPPPEAASVHLGAEKIVSEVQQKFAKLHEIVTQKRQREAEGKKKAWEQIGKSFQRLAELNKNLQEGMVLKDEAAFNQWQGKWRKQLDAAKTEAEAAKFFFPDIYQYFGCLVYCLENALYVRAGRKQRVDIDSLKFSIAWRRYDLEFRRLAEILAKKLAEAESQ